MPPFLSVIIPAYNEEQRIGATLDRNLRYLESRNWDWEMIVVSDGSRDDTVGIVNSFIARSPKIKILINAENRGKGAAVRQGMLAATGELRLFMDADNSTPLEELDKLLIFIKPHDVVIGSLSAPGAQIDKHQFFMRALAGWAGNMLIRLVVLPGIYDTQRGFKLFTANAAISIFSKLKIERWGFDIEVLALARTLGFAIKEIPVHWSHDPRSKIRAWAYPQVLSELLRIRWWLWTDVYRIRRIGHAEYCKRFIPNEGKVLDIGSGRGKFACDMAGFGFRVYGIELSANYMRQAEALAKTRGVFVRFLRGSAERLPFLDSEFDFVNCAEVSEHVADPEKMCREIYRVLKPGGKCYISFHNRYGFYDYHFHLPLINWMPRVVAEMLLKVLGRSKQDSPDTGLQQLRTMHYYRYGVIIRLLSALDFIAQDIRMSKIRGRFGILAPFIAGVYIVLLRPFYFNTFHILLEKR